MKYHQTYATVTPRRGAPKVIVTYTSHYREENKQGVCSKGAYFSDKRLLTQTDMYGATVRLNQGLECKTIRNETSEYFRSTKHMYEVQIGTVEDTDGKVQGVFEIQTDTGLEANNFSGKTEYEKYTQITDNTMVLWDKVLPTENSDLANSITWEAYPRKTSTYERQMAKTITNKVGVGGAIALQGKLGGGRAESSSKTDIVQQTSTRYGGDFIKTTTLGNYNLPYGTFEARGKQYLSANILDQKGQIVRAKKIIVKGISDVFYPDDGINKVKNGEQHDLTYAFIKPDQTEKSQFKRTVNAMTNTYTRGGEVAIGSRVKHSKDDIYMRTMQTAFYLSTYMYMNSNTRTTGNIRIDGIGTDFTNTVGAGIKEFITRHSEVGEIIVGNPYGTGMSERHESIGQSASSRFEKQWCAGNGIGFGLTKNSHSVRFDNWENTQRTNTTYIAQQSNWDRFSVDSLNIAIDPANYTQRNELYQAIRYFEGAVISGKQVKFGEEVKDNNIYMQLSYNANGDSHIIPAIMGDANLFAQSIQTSVGIGVGGPNSQYFSATQRSQEMPEKKRVVFRYSMFTRSTTKWGYPEEKTITQTFYNYSSLSDRTNRQIFVGTDSSNINLPTVSYTAHCAEIKLEDGGFKTQFESVSYSIRKQSVSSEWANMAMATQYVDDNQLFNYRHKTPVRASRVDVTLTLSIAQLATYQLTFRNARETTHTIRETYGQRVINTFDAGNYAVTCANKGQDTRFKASWQFIFVPRCTWFTYEIATQYIDDTQKMSGKVPDWTTTVFQSIDTITDFNFSIRPRIPDVVVADETTVEYEPDGFNTSPITYQENYYETDRYKGGYDRSPPWSAMAIRDRFPQNSTKVAIPWYTR